MGACNTHIGAIVVMVIELFETDYSITSDVEVLASYSEAVKFVPPHAVQGYKVVNREGAPA